MKTYVIFEESEEPCSSCFFAERICIGIKCSLYSFGKHKRKDGRTGIYRLATTEEIIAYKKKQMQDGFHKLREREL